MKTEIFEYDRRNSEPLKKLLAFSQDTMVPAFLTGNMGRAWADDAEKPTCAQVAVGDFELFGGDAKSPAARTLIRNRPGNGPAAFASAGNEEWARLIEQCHAGHCQKIERYAIRKKTDGFDAEKLRGFIGALPDGYSVRQIDGELYQEAMREPWSSDFCALFASEQDFLKRGLGFGVVYEGKLVAGASSYWVYDRGIEIEIDTRRDYRRRGLASACASALILECVKRGLYPSWDAANKISLHLAQRLGYEFRAAYTVYQIDFPAR